VRYPPPKSLEGALHEEWRLLANISRSPRRPVGIGVLIHASLESQVRLLPPVLPPDTPEKEWAEAVNGRLLHIQLERPQLTTWWIVGIYQHVARPDNSTKRDRLLQCLTALKEEAACTKWLLPMHHYLGS
jgi:hypothetical protein